MRLLLNIIFLVKWRELWWMLFWLCLEFKDQHVRALVEIIEMNFMFLFKIVKNCSTWIEYTGNIILFILYFNVECKPGYTGLNCIITCPYPTYGDRCQGYCDCSKDKCDVSTGCRSLTTSKPSLRDPILFNLFAFNKFDIRTVLMYMSGYSGPTCNIQCPFPTFGERCQGFCNSSRNLCDVSLYRL